jgi:hypothetical protein
MVEAVLVFGLLSAVFEAVILMKLPVRWRLRLLGSGFAVAMIHVLVTVANLSIHWGTLTGSMTAVIAGLASFVTIPAVRWYCGCIKARRYYPGLKHYHLS